MTSAPVSWPQSADAVIRGDLTVAVAYLTPAGGAVITSVSPVGLGDRENGVLGFTTSLGFPKKLERILRDPHVAVAYHTREHGFASDDTYVLAQGTASVDLRPSPGRLQDLMRASEPFLGETKRGLVWDWLLREYHQERVFVDIGLERIALWDNLAARGAESIIGTAWPRIPAPQKPPKNGTEPRVDTSALKRQLHGLPHRLIAYRGADGYPVILPAKIIKVDATGLHLDIPSGPLPLGGRRAGFLAHSFNPQCVGLGMRTLTGWLEITDDGALYSPHTSKGLAAPPYKTLLTVSNGLMAKYGLWRAQRDGTAERLHELARNTVS
ncbi:hypothetical protein [Streptomyces sp. NPDC096934]|uniref:hypothetical protein n=1 Tax=Streptomyces sp. NPDC096934 TaxID=3155551 RepID=UPI00332F6F54